MEAIEHNRIHNSVGSHCNCADIEVDRLRAALRRIVASGAYPEAVIAQEALDD